MISKILNKIQKTFCKNVKIESVNLALKAEVYIISDKNKALTLLNKAIIFDCKNDSFYYSRALIFMEKKKYKTALKDIDTALSINPNIYCYYLIRGELHNIMKNTEKAISDIKRAYSLVPKPELYYVHKSDKARKNNNTELADKYLKAANRIKNFISENNI